MTDNANLLKTTTNVGKTPGFIKWIIRIFRSALCHFGMDYQTISSNRRLLGGKNARKHVVKVLFLFGSIRNKYILLHRDKQITY